MVKIGKITAKWKANYIPIWAINATIIMIDACNECIHENRPVFWLW